MGWHSIQVAEEALIDLPSLEFKGKAWQDVRTAMNQAAKQGIELRLGALADQPRGIQTQVRAISTEWVQDKGPPELGFTLGAWTRRWTLACAVSVPDSWGAAAGTAARSGPGCLWRRRSCGRSAVRGARRRSVPPAGGGRRRWWSSG